MSIVTLLTDFGVEDAYVGTMKGAVMSINPAAVIIDITHHIAPQNLHQGAYIIASCYNYFPEKTVHIIVVDPGVGGNRAIIAVKAMKHFFLAPNNGVLTLLMDKTDIDTIVRVENTRFFLKPVSQTFHGRDIFAPVGAYLAKGVDINTLGPKMDKQEIVYLRLDKPYVNKDGELMGTIVTVDRFGNCVTNIDERCLNKFRQTEPFKTLEFIVGDKRVEGLALSYSDVKPKNPLAVVGSFGYLEVALNCGNAKNYLNVQIGDTVRVALKR
jgi:S-adenosyl-L-methionine hydrolase (adenosine-forming)